jgi:hypothetical protein
MRIRDAEVKAMRENEKDKIRQEDEARAQEERKKRQFKFNRTTYSLYLKTYPYAMSYFLNDVVHISLNADPQSLTDIELDKINEVVAEGYNVISDTGIYTVEWFKETDERERKEEAEYEAKQEREKQEKVKPKSEKVKYFKTITKDGKTTRTPIKNGVPFEYAGINFVIHREGAGWHSTEATTGLMFVSGNTEAEATARTTNKIQDMTPMRVMSILEQAKQALKQGA